MSEHDKALDKAYYDGVSVGWDLGEERGVDHERQRIVKMLREAGCLNDCGELGSGRDSDPPCEYDWINMKRMHHPSCPHATADRLEREEG